MADPSIRLSNSAVQTSSGANIAVGITGTPADGELILFIVGWNESPSFSTPAVAGFSTIASIVTADWNPLYILGKIASSEGANPTYTCSFTGGSKDGSSSAVVLVIQNANSSLPTNVASTHDTSGSTTYSIPALTTTKNGSFDLVAVTPDGNNGTGPPNFSSWGSSLAELFDICPSSPNNYAQLGVAGVTRASAGSQAATTVTGVSSDKNVALRIEVEPAGGSTTNQSLNVTSTTTATIKRSVGKILAKTVTSTATMSRVKQAVKALSVTVTTTRTMLRSVGKVVSVTSTATATMSRALTWAKTLSVTSTTAASMVRSVGKVVSATSTTTASMVRRTGKVIAATATTTASSVRSVGKTIAVTSTSTATLVATKAFQVALSATSATTATMGRQVGKVVAVTSSTTATMVRSIGKVLSVTSTASSVLSATKAFQMVLSVTSTTTATVSLTVGKLVSAASIGTATVRKSVAKTFSATSTTTASIGKSIGKVLGAVGSLVTGLIATFQGAGDVEQVIGLARIFDEATAHALLHDSAVNTALVSDELTGRVEVRD